MTPKEFIIDQIQSVESNVSTPLRVVDGEDSRDLTNNRIDQDASLNEANYVTIWDADRNTDPIGTEYDHKVESIIGVRIEGAHHLAPGHVDPAGNNGIPWSGDNGLVEKCRDAVLGTREFPSVNQTDTGYVDLRIQNESPRSHNYREYYRYDFEVRFRGYKTLS